MASIINSISFKNFYNYYGDYEDNLYELKKGVKGPELSSYGFSDSTNLKLTSEHDIELASLIIKKILKESGMDSRTAIAALPAYAVFSSVLNDNSIIKPVMGTSFIEPVKGQIKENI